MRSTLQVIIVTMLTVLVVHGSPTIMNESQDRSLKVHHIKAEIEISDLNGVAWKSASQVLITHYWSGKKAPQGRTFEARLLWSDTALYVRFVAFLSEPLVVSEDPDLAKKTVGLWNRDVCEIFVAPDRSLKGKYFEFEIAPTGEWIDLAIEYVSRKRKTDLNYRSGMASAAKIEAGRVVSAIKIPWEAFGERPKAGDVWLGNLFRCVGRDPDRGYLAWQPTKTAKPNFHVPEKFGEFHFTR